MRYIVNSIVLVLLFTGWCCGQEGTRFEELTFEEALKKSASVGKPLFIDCYTKTCGPCKYMMDNIFPLKVCGDYFNSHYVCIKKDMEEGDGVEIARKYKTQIYPTFLIINPDGSEFCRIMKSVSKPEDDFVGIVKSAVYLAGLEKRYKEGERGEDFIKEYITLLRDKDTNKLQQVMGEVMPPMKIETLCRQENWELISKNLHKIDNQLFRHLLKERKAFSKILGQEVVYNKLISDYKQEFRMMKLMGLDYRERMKDLQLLEQDGYPELKKLRYAMLVRQVVNGKEPERSTEILYVIEKEIPSWKDEADKNFVFSEMTGIEKVLTVKDQERLLKSLEKMQTGDETLQNTLQRLIKNLQK